MRTLILTVALVVGAAEAKVEALENRPDRESAEGLGDVVAGTLNLQAVSGCYILATGTITSANVGGTVDGALNVWDDGNFLAGYAIPVPGDGGTYNWCVVHQQLVPVLQGAAGLGVYLEDEVGPAATVTLVSNGSYNDVTEVCTGPAPSCASAVLEVPALDRTGIVILALLLGAAAVVLSVRLRARRG